MADKIDSIDMKILEILNYDARITMKELARKLGLSAPAVADRVKRLESCGIITSYKATLDRNKLGQNISVFINVDMPASKYGAFEDFAKISPEINEYYYVTGQYSLVVKAFVESTRHLAKLLEKVQEFGTTETFVVMYSNIKENLF